MVVNPTATSRRVLKEFLEAQGLGVRIYDHFPPGGVAPACIVLQQVSGSSSDIGLGEVISGPERGHEIRLRFQIDIYAKDDKQRDELADAILSAIWSGRAELRAKGIELYPVTRIQDVMEEEPGARVWRKSIDIPLSILMTPS